MKYLVLFIAVLTLLGCSALVKPEASVEYIFQNIGSRKINDATFEFGERELSPGILPSTAKATMGMRFIPKSRIVLIKLREDEMKYVFRVDMGEETIHMLAKGDNALFFQVNLDNNEVLFNMYESEVALDILFSEQKLTNAVKAERIGGPES